MRIRTRLTKEEEEKIQAVRDQLGTDFCRRCNYCAPCSVGIQIPSVFLFAGYLQRYDLEQWARDRYNTLKVKASPASAVENANHAVHITADPGKTEDLCS